MEIMLGAKNESLFLVKVEQSYFLTKNTKSENSPFYREDGSEIYHMYHFR